jgi:hypothetical protein
MRTAPVSFRQSNWLVTLPIWLGVLGISSLAGGVVFLPFEKTASGLLLGNLITCIAAWLCLWFDEGASRRMRSTIGAGMFFYGWGMLFVAGYEYLIFGFWIDAMLIMLAGAALSFESAQKIADDLVG